MLKVSLIIIAVNLSMKAEIWNAEIPNPEIVYNL